MKAKKGFYILETLLAIVMLSMVLMSLFSMVSFLQRRTVKSSYDTDASLLLQEGMEIAHSALLASWEGYPDGIYSPAFDSDEQNWVLIEGEETNLQALFTRRITLVTVCRDSSSGERLDTSECSGQIDKNSRIIKTTLIWSDNGNTSEVEGSLLVLKLPE